MRISPPLTSSSPATIRSAVVFPQPDGPTSTMNSPSAISSVSSSTARVPSPKVLSTRLKVTLAIAPPRSMSAAPRRRALPDDQARRQQVGAPGPLATGDPVEHEAGGDLADLAHRLVDRGQRRVDVRRDRQIVVADHRDVLGNAKPLGAEPPDRAEGDEV